jgi:DNA-binding NarL/FixJ family response regulator
MKPQDRPSIAVLIVEDAKFDEAATRELLSHAGYSQIESVANAQDARAALARAPFDIVIVDLRIPARPRTQEHEAHGLDLVDDISVLGIPQIVFSSWTTANWVAAVVARGIGYLRKNDIDHLLLLDNAIQTTLSGGIVYSRTPLGILIQSNLIKNKRADVMQLSSREKQVVYLYAFKFFGREKSDEQVAKILTIQPDTASKHRKNAMEKLEIHNGAELVSWSNRNPHEFDEVRKLYQDIPEIE